MLSKEGEPNFNKGMEATMGKKMGLAPSILNFFEKVRDIFSLTEENSIRTIV